MACIYCATAQHDCPYALLEVKRALVIKKAYLLTALVMSHVLEGVLTQAGDRAGARNYHATTTCRRPLELVLPHALHCCSALLLMRSAAAFHCLR